MGRVQTSIIYPFLMCFMATLARLASSYLPQHSAEFMKLFREAAETSRVLPESPPIGTSAFSLGRFATQELEAGRRLRDMVGRMRNATIIMEKYLDSFDELEAAGLDKEGFATNPLHAFALVKHTLLGWVHVEESLTRIKEIWDHVEWVVDRRSTLGVATDEDLSEVAGGIARLYDYYNLDLTALSRAHIISVLQKDPIESSLAPSVWDFSKISSEAVSMNILNAAVEFLRQALQGWDARNMTMERRRNPFQQDFADLSRMNNDFRKISKLHDQVLERKGERTKKHSTFSKPLNKTLARKKKYHKKKDFDKPLIPSLIGRDTDSMERYHHLCQGKYFAASNVTSRLRCRYVHNGSPYYKVGPLKLEEHYLDPFVVTIYDVLHPREIEVLRNTAVDLLEKSKTIRNNQGMEVSHTRTSAGAWMWHHNHPILPELTFRIEQLTGLTADEILSSEAYQVANYGVGGHYVPHLDSFNTGLQRNRIATFLIYMTDVEQGGTTVFPWLGMGVHPKKGAALLWYNINRKGDRDARTQHGACPVLLGDKWIINKWIRYGSQFRSAACDLDMDANIAAPLY